MRSFTAINMISKVPFLLLVFIIDSQAFVHKLPSGMKLCNKYDPDLDLCLKRLFEQLRPRLAQGIPEADLPALDPLYIAELYVSFGRQGKMWFSNVQVTGVNGYVINEIRADIKRLEASVSITFPFLRYEGFYDIDGRFMHFNLKGKGPIQGNATEVTSNADLKGRILRSTDDERYVEFTSADVDVTIKDYAIHIEELFNDSYLNNQVNILLNDKDSRYRKYSIQTAKPIIDRVASKIVLEVINKVAKRFSFDQIFL